MNLRAYVDPGRNLLVRLRFHLTNLRALVPLCGYIRSSRPHAVISSVFAENVQVILARKLTGADYRVVIRQPEMLGLALLDLGTTKRVLMRWLVRWLYPHADVVVAVSRGVAEDLVRIVPGIRTKLKVIYSPVDMGGIQRPALEEPGHPWFKNGSHQVILGVGRLCRQKDFPTLVKAFARVRQAEPVKLVILGEGQERQRLEALVAELGLGEDVSLPGFVRNPYSYMRRSAVFALSSSTEGLPNMLLEALACGCPVVSTDCPSGPSEILEGGKWGHLVPVGDAEALATAIERTLRKPPSPDLLRQRAAFFSVDRGVSQYLDTLKHPRDSQPLAPQIVAVGAEDLAGSRRRGKPQQGTT